MKKIIVTLMVLLALITTSNAQKINPPSGRIAIIADGNSPDPDDLGGTAVSIALLRASGLENRLVHYSHSCDLIRVNRISEKAEVERHGLMQSCCDVTARRWGGFENLTFFDAKWQLDETIKDLSKAINASSTEDPLWIIEAGEPDIIGFALDATPKEKHQFVKVLTHHPANDNAGDFYTWNEILAFGVEEVRIPDQNIKLKVDIEVWDWARIHPDPRIQQLWLQGKIAEVDDVVNFQKGKWDCSDAGMVLYWITGANIHNGLEQGTVDDVKNILLNFIEPKKTTGKPKQNYGLQLINTDKEPDINSEKFFPLFNGKNLDGWTPKQGTMKFEVKDGEIVGTCSEGPSTFLCTDKEYTNFIFTCETKWEVDGNTGVQVRSKIRKDPTRYTVYGPQVEMEDLGKKGRGWSGGIYGQSCGGWFYPLKAPEHEVLKDAIDRSGWNRMTVKIDGNVFKTWINGLPAAHWVDDENKYPKGFIGLQVHGGKQGVIHWRNLRIREL